MKHKISQILSAVFLALVVCLIGIASNRSALACECEKRSSLKQEISSSTVVFEGEVIDVKESKTDSIVTFKPKKSWLGGKVGIYVVRTSNQGKACGFVFKKGAKYLVFAYGEIVSKRTDICTRTKEIKSYKEDLNELTQ